MEIIKFGQSTKNEEMSQNSSEDFWNSRTARNIHHGFILDDFHDARLAGEDVESRRLWKPMHVQPVFASGCFFVDGETGRLFDCEVKPAQRSSLDDDKIEQVMKVLQTVLGSGG